MTIEILSAKIMAPFFGNSLYVWTAVLATTLLGLAGGYFYGGNSSTKANSQKTIFIVSTISVLLVLMLPFSSKFILQQTLSLGLEGGTVIASLLIILPIIFCFGMISPLLISEISKTSNSAGKNASLIYTVSTIGGIIFALLTGLYFITTFGIKNTCFITGFILLTAVIIALFSNKNQFKIKHN